MELWQIYLALWNSSQFTNYDGESADLKKALEFFTFFEKNVLLLPHT